MVLTFRSVTKTHFMIFIGDGRLDCKLLTEAFPNVQKYIAIEPDQDLLKTVERRVNALERKDQLQVSKN